MNRFFALWKVRIASILAIAVVALVVYGLLFPGVTVRASRAYVSFDLRTVDYATTSTNSPTTNAGGGTGTFGLSSGNGHGTDYGSTLFGMRFQNNAGDGVLTALAINFYAGAGGNVSIGVYADSTGTPGTLLLDAGAVATASGWCTISSLNLAVTNGTYYWLACNAQNDNNDFNYQTGGAAGSFWYKGSVAYGALPGTFPYRDGDGTTQYEIQATVTLGWTNPTNAYADGSSYASMTSGAPSANAIYGGYGFALTSETVTQVRVRLDAYCAGSATAYSKTRIPTGDISNSGTWDDTTSMFDLVNDTAESNDGDTSYLLHGTTAGNALFSFDAFDVESDATITNLTVGLYAKDNSSGTNKMQPALRVNSTNYLTTSTSTEVNASNYTVISYSFTNNPNETNAWEYDDINGGGDSPLQGFGVRSADASPQVRLSAVYAKINYTRVIYDEQINVYVSWDGGSTWSSAHAVNLTSAEATNWVDVTSDTAWTASKLNDSNFKIKVEGITVSSASEVRLDWLPAEITYSSGDSYDITNDPSSKSFGTVLASSTLYAYGSAPSNPVTDGQCSFTLTATGTGSTDIDAHGHNSAGGAGMTLTSSAPGASQFRLTLYYSGQNPASGLVVSPTDQEFYDNLVSGGHIHWDFKLELGSSGPPDAQATIVTLTARSHS